MFYHLNYHITISCGIKTTNHMMIIKSHDMIQNIQGLKHESKPILQLTRYIEGWVGG